MQRKEESVSEYTERFCQSAVIYSGIVDDPESVLEDKGPLVRIWSDGLVAEYRKALPFLDLTWSNRTLRSNLDRLATWERDADVKAKVRVAAATFNTTKQDNRCTTNTTEAKGNALADVAAKQACFYATVQVCSGSTAQKTILPPESIVNLYKDVPLYEAWTWLDKGATVDSSGCWTKGGKYVAPESLLPYLAQQYTVWVIVVQQR